MQAEAKGDPGQRVALAKQAQQVVPDFAPAHWQAGEVKLNTGWTHFDTLSKDDKLIAKMSEYRQRRDQAAITASDQTDLALWCEKAGLAEHAKLHWLAVLKVQPNSKEAQAKLGVVRYRGRFMSPNQVAAFNDALKTRQADFKKWKDQLAALRKQIDNGQNTDRALDEIRSIREVVAIPAIEAEFGKAKAEMGKAAVYALSNMPDQSATQSLAKFAILSNYPEVRTQAAEALRSRSLYSYAPMLLSALQAPNVVSFYEYELPNGEAGFQISIYRDGPKGDSMYAAVERTGASYNPIYNPLEPGSGPATSRNLVNAVQEQSNEHVYLARDASIPERLATGALAGNDQIVASNSRISGR